ACELYGKSLAANVDSKESALWLERAKDARNNGLLVRGDDHYCEARASSLVTSTSLAAALLYIFVRYFRYRPSSRAILAAERDLLLAIAYQRNGQEQEAMKIYESLPQFAESWNNLGVLLKSSGDSEGSRRAFEQALQRKPGFPEAEWNLGKPARGEWVQFHAQ